MQEYVLFLAALAALASCVKENNLHPEQTSDNLVTIKAVSADTKTLLDGTDVVWEADDAIKVVYRGTSETFMTDFSVDGSVNGSSATFKGVFDHSVESDRNPYAVYPASSVTEDAGTGSAGTGNVAITHSLSEVQDGTIASGMNLSSAILSADDMAAGTATAVFNNALTLLQIVVPEGVKSVALTANYGLVGDATFTVDDKDSQGEPTGDNDDNGNPIYEKISATGKLTTNGGDKETVTLQDGDGALAAKTHSVLVYPGSNTDLKVTVTGTDGTEYTNTVGVKFSAGEYRTLDLTKLFNMAIEEEEVKPVSPMGETFSFEVVAAEQYEYEVVIEGNPAWITLNENAHVTSKAFVGTTVSFTVDANTTGSPREANVTITWNDGEEQSRYFKVTQVSAYLDFVYVDGNPENELIEWEEAFAVYASESDAQSKTNATKGPYKNTFNIELSDAPEKGTYMITNMFYADSYYGEGYQMISSKGAKYYADYADGVLTVKKNDSVNSYYFSENINLTYDSANKKFTAAPIPTTSSNVWIGGYTVTVKADDPGAGDDSPYAALIGEYTEEFADGSYYGNPAKGVLTIAESDDANYHLKMTFFGGTSAAVTVYATVAGNTITTVQPAGYTNMGKFYVSTLTVDGDVISGTLNFDYPTVSDYTATKVDEDPFKNLYGEYAEEFADGSYYGNPAKGVLTIAESDDANYHLKMTFFGETSAAVTVYATVDGNTITTVQPAGYTNMGKFYVSTLTVDGDVISGTLNFDYPTITDYTATKQ